MNIRGICAINAKKIFIKTCQIHGGQPTRMYKSTYIRMCKARRSARYSNVGFGNATVNPECFDCEIGALIAAGQDFPRPECMTWIEPDCGLLIANAEPALFADMIPAMAKAGMIQKKENSMKNGNEITTGLPGKFEVFKSLPESFDGLRLPDLRHHWKREPGPNGQPGTCVNCGRMPVTIRHNGICASCQNACIKKQGHELLDALQMIRARLMQPESKTRSAAARALRRPAAKVATPAAVEKPQDVMPPMDKEVVMRSPLHDIGSRYIIFGKMMQDINLTMGELAAAAHELGLQININVGVEK